MKMKYKIGNFTIEIKSQTQFENVPPYSLFVCETDSVDYRVSVIFTSDFPVINEDQCYTTQDRICFTKQNELHCAYKSRDNKSKYYAYRRFDGENIYLLIDDRYKDLLRADVIFSLIGIEELAIHSGGCVLHSSFIEKNGSALLFTGPCSIGKSTQANLWRDYANATIINGDKTFIFEENGVMFASGIPFSGSSKDCKNLKYPLKAIICLDKSQNNSATKLIGNKSFYKIFKNCYPVPYSRNLTSMLFDFVQKLSQNVNVYEYACLADKSAVRYLERTLCLILQNR